MAYFKLPGVRHNYQGMLGGFMFSNGVCHVADDSDLYRAAKNMLIRYYAAKEYDEYPKSSEVQGDGGSTQAPKGSSTVSDDDGKGNGDSNGGSKEHSDASGDGHSSNAPEGSIDRLNLTAKQIDIVYQAIDKLDTTEPKHWAAPGVPNAEFIYRLTQIPIGQQQLADMASKRAAFEAPQTPEEDAPKRRGRPPKNK